MNKEEFKEYLKKLNINFTNDQLLKLEIYNEFLIEYNSHTNLTSITDKKEVYLKHFYDSLTIVKTIDLKKITTLLDIGTGAGFPGVVLKIFFPNLKVTLLDSNNKKTKFLEQLIEKLNLINIEVINDRSEKYILNKREYYDLVTSRAVANLKILTELSLPYVKIGGFFIPLKGDSDLELKESEYAINILGGQIMKIEKLLLPIENSKRMLIVIQKIKETPKEYPRVFDKILKKPLKIKRK